MLWRTGKEHWFDMFKENEHGQLSPPKLLPFLRREAIMMNPPRQRTM